MIYIGTSGWFYRSWQPGFYPAELPTYKWLEFYAMHFNTVEINSTFYRVPSASTVKGWIRKLPTDFHLTCKVNRTITHRKRLKNVREDLIGFLEVLSPIKQRYGMLLFQLPPSIKLDMGELEEFLSSLPGDFRYAVEFRNSRWFDDSVFELLSRYNVAFVSVSAPGLPDDIVVTTDFLYVRFHGKDRWYDYLYSDEELSVWASKIKKHTAVSDAYCYFNNDVGGYAIRNALLLQSLLS